MDSSSAYTPAERQAGILKICFPELSALTSGAAVVICLVTGIALQTELILLIIEQHGGETAFER